MTLGDVIYKYRTERGMSMDKFSEISGISKGYISMLEKNRTARGDEPSPSFEMYKSVARTMGVEVDDLIRAVEGKISLGPRMPNDAKISPMPKMRRWKILGGTACGEPIFKELDNDTILAPDNIDADYVFRCVGDSMIGARILDGDVVFVKSGEFVENGQIAVVSVEDSYSLKRIYRGVDYLELRSENPKFPPIIIQGGQVNAEIVGKAVHFLSRVI